MEKVIPAAPKYDPKRHITAVALRELGFSVAEAVPDAAFCRRGDVYFGPQAPTCRIFNTKRGSCLDITTEQRAVQFTWLVGSVALPVPEESGS